MADENKRDDQAPSRGELTQGNEQVQRNADLEHQTTCNHQEWPDKPGNEENEPRTAVESYLSNNPTRSSAWFLGPKAENAGLVEDMLLYILRDYFHWRRNYYPSDEILITRRMRRDALDWDDKLFQQVSEMIALLKRHFPFYSPRYIAHQLSDQTIPSILGYFAGMLYNPNNVTPEAAPVTVDWELEVGKDILHMLGYQCPPSAGASSAATRRAFGWAHITSGGTVANLEALWVCRNVRYFPLAVKHAAKEHNISITVKMPNNEKDQKLLTHLDDSEALSIKPNESIYLLERFVHAVKLHYDLSTAEEASMKAWDLIEQSGFSMTHGGTATCFHVLPPAIFVSGAAHYSVAKAADLLGIGRDNVFLVDMDQQFRLDVKDLRQKIERAVQQGLYPLATIAIAGTTEEGAVDPVHEVHDLRLLLEREKGFSFWLHIDAAWGGYIRSLLVDDNTRENTESSRNFQTRLTELELRTKRDFILKKGVYSKKLQTHWSNKDVCGAFFAFERAESITVDPHKMGYIRRCCTNQRRGEFLPRITGS